MKKFFTPHTEPEHVRAKLAASYRRLASGRRFSKAERAEFGRMADSWERTLHKAK
jgi:hypothetical protein